MDNKDIQNEQRIYGMLHHIPILRESEVHLFEELIDLYKPRRVLEIGTAIAYSTLLIAKHMDREGSIVSVEIDEDRHTKALEFVKASPFKGRIDLRLGDACEVIEELEGPFDLVFLDGPKGQYLKQLEALIPKLEDGAVILADNVLFRGYVRGEKEPPKRFKTIVKRLQAYLAFVEDSGQFNTTIYPLGDGMSISIWKGRLNERTD